MKIYNHECTACPLHESAKTVCMEASRGSLPFLVVGEGPGRNEDEVGEPFVGRAGQILDRALATAFKTTRKTVRQMVWVTNAVKCRPPSNRTPDEDEVDTCVDLYLTKEIKQIDPVVILALGNPALYALFQVRGVTQYRGVFLNLPGKGTPVMVTYHPMYIGYQGHDSQVAEQFRKDIAKFAREGMNIIGA